MTVLLTKVDWSGKGTSGNDESFSFDDLEKVTLKRDSEAKSSTMNIRIQNSYDRFLTGFTQPFNKYNANTNDIIFKEGDTLTVYAAEITSARSLDTSTNSADLLMTGEISEVNVKGEHNSAKVSLRGVDKTYIILNRLFTQAFTASQNFNAPELVQKVVRFVTDDVDSDALSFDDNGNLVVNGRYSVDARLVNEGGFIEDTRINDSVFPDLSMGKVAKPAYEWVKDLSSTESTNDFAGSDNADAPTQNRNMIFYVDELNRFHWFYPRDVITTTLSSNISSSTGTIALTSSTDFPNQGSVFIGSERIDYTAISGNNLTGAKRGSNNTIAASHSSGDTVKNAIVIIEGDTSSGFTLQTYNITKKTFDVVNFVIFSAGQDMKGNGITNFFFDRATKSKELKDTFKSYADIGKNLMQKEITDGRLTLDNAVTSAFTFKGNRYKETTGNYNGGGGITTSWGIVVTTNDGYNTAFRTEAVKQATMRAQMLTTKRGSPRWKGTMNFKFARFTAGELFEFTSTRAGINQQSLRIKTAIYNLTKTGGAVTLTVEEDEAKLGVK